MNDFRPPQKFVGLHNHTGASVYDGLGNAEDHIKFVIENGMDAFAITEHGHCNSFATAYLYAEKLRKQAGAKFKFVAGAELYLHPDLNEWRNERSRRADVRDAERLAREEAERLKTQVTLVVDEDDEASGVEISNALTVEREDESKGTKRFDPINRRHHIVVIPKTSVGLQRLFHLVSRGYSEGFYRFPRIDYAMLREAASGGHLLVTTACLGGTMSYAALTQAQGVSFEHLDHTLLDDPHLMRIVQHELGETYAQLVSAVGAENVFLEMQFNRLSAQCYVNRALLAFAAEHGLTQQLLCCADSHYPRPELWREREIYKKLGWLNYTEIDPSKLPASRHQLKCELFPKNASQMWDEYLSIRDGKQFYDDVLVRDAIERSHTIAHELVGDVHPDRSMKLPTSIVVPAGMTADEQLLKLCRVGMAERGFVGNDTYERRLDEELQVISEKKFAEYFLTLREIIHVAQESMLVGPGRGSGAGSLVTYVLRITDVDPVKYDLLFARFLNRFREEAPDVDCVHGCHLVLMSDGSYRHASSITVGDMVLGGDGKSHRVIAKYVRERRDGEVPLRITVVADDETLGSIVVVPKHKFVLRDGSIVRADAISIGDELMATCGVAVLAIERLPELCDALFVDVTVEDDHRFRIVPFDVNVDDDGTLQHTVGYGETLTE